MKGDYDESIILNLWCAYKEKIAILSKVISNIFQVLNIIFSVYVFYAYSNFKDKGIYDIQTRRVG